MPSTTVNKELTVYQDNEGQYILVTQADRSLQRMYIKANGPPQISPELRLQLEQDKQHERLQKHDEKLFEHGERLPNLEQYHDLQRKEILRSRSKRVKMVDEKLVWNAKSKVDSFNKSYTPSGGTVDILDRKKLAPATRWKAAPRVDTINTDFIPSYSDAHLLEQPRWNQNAKVQHKYVRTKIVATGKDNINERNQWHKKASNIPHVDAVNEGNTEERSSSTQTVEWQILPDINSSKVKANRTLSSSQTSRSLQNGMQSPASPWLPKITDVVYNSKTKKWVASVTKSENSTPDPSPLNTHDSLFRRRRYPLKLHRDPIINQRIKNYRQSSKYSSRFPSRSQSVASHTSTNSTYEQPSKSIIFDNEQGILWNTGPGDIENDYGTLKMYMNNADDMGEENEGNEEAEETSERDSISPRVQEMYEAMGDNRVETAEYEGKSHENNGYTEEYVGN